ncbi:hypothetical protein [Aliikangiella coralliicola]|uniref:Uncharacterized protein n=1 Tax=Aliikangiella coralliicola TaxID=2592383 RepID=A0A545U4E6_9GAMM|nr:hypothetical protein [Aliikangiella coralliicola]TQV84350.1 hypothetical protein FLL46_22255 [Aliikangiella coralliicola]
MHIQQLNEKLDEKIDHNQLSISDLILVLPEVADLISTFPFPQSGKLQNVDQALTATRLRLSGEFSMENTGVVKLGFVFNGPNVKSDIALEADLERFSAISFASFDNFALKQLMISLQLKNNEINGKASANLQIGNKVNLPISIAFPPHPSHWYLELERAVHLSDFADFSSQFGGQSLQPVTEILGVVSGVTINAFGVGFDIEEKTISRLFFQIDLNTEWDMLPGVIKLRSPSLGLGFSGSLSSLEITLGGSVVVDDFEIPLAGLLKKDFSFGGGISHLALTKIARELYPALPEMIPEINLDDAVVNVDSTGLFAFSGNLAMNFSTLASRFKLPLLPGMTDLSLSDLSFEFNPKADKYRLAGELDGPIVFPIGNEENNNLQINRLAWSFSREDGKANTSCQLSLSGQTKISEQLYLNCEKLEISWDSAAQQWKTLGQARISAWGEEYAFEVEVVQRKSVQQNSQQGESELSLVFSYLKSIRLSNLGGLGQLQLNEFSIFTRLGNQGTEWGVRGNAQLTIDHLFDETAELQLAHTTEGNELIFTVKTPNIPAIDLPIEGIPHAPSFDIELDDLRLYLRAAGKKSEANDSASWEINAAGKLTVNDLPDWLSQYFPKAMGGSFAASPKGIKLIIPKENLPQPDFPELKLTFADESVLSLGKPNVVVESLELNLSKPLAIKQTLWVGLPQQLNYLFGRKGDEPNIQFINESFRLELQLAKKLSLRPLSSPFSSLTMYERDGKMWSDWVFGEFASFRLQTPEFGYSNGSWQGSMAFERLTPIKIPMTPVKFVLKQLGISETLLNSLPDAIELVEVDFGSEHFYDQLEKLLGIKALAKKQPKLVELLAELLENIKKVIERLPQDFQDYLQIRIPETLAVEISVGGGGSTRFNIATQDDKPLKLLVPGVSLTGPTLFGFTFYRLAFGQMAGGSLAILEIDGHIDPFSLITLVGAPLLPDEGGVQLRNRITLQDTTIVAPTALPIPIPLFYKKLGWDLKNLLGLEINSHWSYPQPSASIFDLAGLFSKLVNFFKNPDYLLHKQPQPENLELEFTLGRNALCLPSYLGGAEIGLPKPLPPLNVYRSTARLLDAMKTGNASYFIEAVPLRHNGNWIRIGEVELSFGPLTLLKASWCITTELEFQKEILNDSEALALIGVEKDNSLIKTLHAVPSDEISDKGFIVLLKAGAGLKGVLSGECQFGLSVTASGGFATGFKWQLKIAEAVSINILGVIQINNDALSVDGSLNLSFGNKMLAETNAGLEISKQHFKTYLEFKLTDAFRVRGDLYIGVKGVEIKGTVAWGIRAKDKADQLELLARFDKQGITFGINKLSVFGNRANAKIILGNPKAPLIASIEIEPQPGIAKALQDSLNQLGKDVANEVDRATKELDHAAENVNKVTLDLNNIKNFVAQQLITTANDLPGIVNRRVHVAVARFIRGVPKSWGRRWAVKTAWNLVKGGVMKTIQRDLAEPIKDMRMLSAQLKRADEATAKKLMLQALNDTLKRYRRYRYTYRVRIVRNFSYTYTYHMPASLQQQIAEGISALKQLDVGQKVVVNRQHFIAAEKRKQILLKDIQKGIEKQTAGVVPQVKYIRFTTGLGVISAAQTKLTIGLNYKGKTHQYELAGDLSSPAGALKKALNQLLN